MKAKLLSRWGAEKGSEFWIGAEASIGRGGDNDVRLDAKPISSRHARLFFDADAGAYFLEDLGSLNGTQIDGTPVERVERLGQLHVLGFGGVCELLFVTVDASAEPAAQAPAPASTEAPAGGGSAEGEPPDEPPDDALGGTRVDAEPPTLPTALAGEEGESTGRGEGTHIEHEPLALPRSLAAEEREGGGSEPPATADAAEPGFVLAVVDKEETLRFPLSPGENLVGRTQGAAVALASRQLSRRHALLTVAGERVTVRDLGSRNHTYVEDRRLEGDAEVEIEARARLRFGLLEAYLLRRDDDDPTAPVDAG